jgi:hypothetical protein
MSPDRDPYILVLAQALNWRAAPPLPWKSLTGSLTLHLIAVTLCLSAFAGAPPTPTTRQASAQRFVPLVYPAPPAKQAVLTVGGRLASPPIALPDTAASKVTVNLNSIRLSIGLDVGNQLPGVVAAQHGMLALLDKDDLDIARYVIEPPEWKPRATTIDISRSLRFRMDPPGKWPVFREAAARYAIDLNQFIGCAVFDAAFGRCLKAAIGSRIRPDAPGPVSSARLAFAAGQACGIEVLDVQYAAGPARK